MPGATTNAPTEINASDHRTLRRIIVISLGFTIENEAIVKCSQQDRQTDRQQENRPDDVGFNGS
jgi:hypothetical protein